MTVAGSDKVGLYEAYHTIRLTTETMGDFRLFLVDFPLLLGTRESSWGDIKKIHRN